MAQDRISRLDNIISIEGGYHEGYRGQVLAYIHDAIEKSGYQDIVLDFSRCISAFPYAMLPTCAQVMNKRSADVDFELILPEKEDLCKLFKDANWAYLLDPERHEQTSFQGDQHVPAIQYKDPEQQHLAVNRIVNSMLGAISNLERSSFAAFEWSINEITDNVLTHANSSIGGLVQVDTFTKNKTVTFLVADVGQTIPKTLRSTHNEITSDEEALRKAIEEGVTRDKSLGQGNGLFGSFQICTHCKGKFAIKSGYAKLDYTDKGGLHLRTEKTFYDGTLIVASINFSNPHLLESALKFDGKMTCTC